MPSPAGGLSHTQLSPHASQWLHGIFHTSMNTMRKCQTTPTCASGAKTFLGVLAACLKCTVQRQKEERSRYHNQVSSCIGVCVSGCINAAVSRYIFFGAQQVLPQTAVISKMPRLLDVACSFPQPAVQKKHLLA